ncbi:hypothetical protein J8273_0016 [Carpediemonas membranifera]|uniref:Uncharacterized protein n=1 Tax=Carpediemonas membranifera TaxID=201153 RepID=A0A8J6AU72_9EUKA|nr:hypothetical protein J8273_0016 [Carpediemonas membranifera]|eukprot:KAG9394816.1 hypothetical protein J8273_0016 [Carpediemonas membranifera]
MQSHLTDHQWLTDAEELIACVDPEDYLTRFLFREIPFCARDTLSTKAANILLGLEAIGDDVVGGKHFNLDTMVS